MNKIYEYFKNVHQENKIAQSFLIGNTTFDEIKDELYLVLKEFFFKNNMNMEENPDLYILKPENGLVSKEDIKILLKEISTTSQFNNVKVYIIDKCEKLNDFAYNAILKTLEEPQEGIFAILISSNIDAVKPTICSRCQKIFVSNLDEENIFSDECIEVGNKLIESIEKENIKTIGKNYKIYSDVEDRLFLINTLKYILNRYYCSLKDVISKKEKSDVITQNNDIISIARKILIINKNISRLDSYLNKNLSIDRFIVEMWRCNI